MEMMKKTSLTVMTILMTMSKLDVMVREKFHCTQYVMIGLLSATKQ